MDMTAIFFEFIYDRQEIWYKRNEQKLPAPWSDEPVFQNYRFCNIYRELDGGTISICRYLQHTDISPEQKLFNIVAYRFFNRRDTIENLFGGLLDPVHFNRQDYEKRFDKIKADKSIFSDAYLISSHPYNASYRAKDKHVQILLMLEDLAPRLKDFIDELKNTLPQRGLSVIPKYVPMAGPFLSGQILLDVTYAKDLVSYTSNDFLIVGPGAKWGLDIITGRKLSAKEADKECRRLHAIQAEEFKKLKKRTGKDWDEIRWKNCDYAGGRFLALHDIQGALCEFRKYWRLKSCEKAKKRYFAPV